MGLAVADYDCDGWFDIFKTNFVDDTCNLYHNNGDGTFTDVSLSSGVGINNQYVAWGCGSSTTTMMDGLTLSRSTDTSIRSRSI